MSDAQQSQPAGSETTSTEAAAALAEIERRQEQVIKATLLPAWVWSVYAAAIIAIGAARDSGDLIVQATAIPLAALVIVGLTIATTPTWRRRVRVNDATQPDGRLTAVIFLMIVLVDAVIISMAVSLAANHVHYPGTISCAAGAAVLVIVGPLVNRYGRRLMLRQARRQINDARQAGSGTS